MQVLLQETVLRTHLLDGLQMPPVSLNIKQESDQNPHESVGATNPSGRGAESLAGSLLETSSVRKCQSADPREVTPHAARIPRSPHIKLR